MVQHAALAAAERLLGAALQVSAINETSAMLAEVSAATTCSLGARQLVPATLMGRCSAAQAVSGCGLDVAGSTYGVAVRPAKPRTRACSIAVPRASQGRSRCTNAEIGRWTSSSYPRCSLGPTARLRGFKPCGGRRAAAATDTVARFMGARCFLRACVDALSDHFRGHAYPQLARTR